MMMIKSTFKSGIKRVAMEIHYHLYSFLNSVIPKKDNYIFIYDAPFMRQNCWAFYKYLIEHGYNKKYRIFYYTENIPSQYNSSITNNMIKSIIKGWYLHLVSKYTFYEYHNFKFNCKPGCQQITVYLTHGMPLKNYGYLVNKPKHPFEDDYSYLLMTSNYYIPIMKRCLGVKDEQVYIGGMPRCDQLINPCDLSWLNVGSDRTILWMPTVRKSSANSISDSEKSFPLLDEKKIENLDYFLSKNNICLIIKPHPLQNTIDWLINGKYNNIRIVRNEDLLIHKVELYEMLGNVDLLLTDYSSVFSDFLLTDKPLAFVIDDIDDYKIKRGFVDDSLVENLPGPIISTYEDLIKEMMSIDNNKDTYSQKRKELREKLSPYSQSGLFSRDICTFLGIFNEERK